VRTGGDKRNREYLHGHVISEAPDALDALCFDPQTSGGLLAAVEPELVGAAVNAGFTVIGRFEAGEPGVHLA
jgi:selenophosphate synthase